MIGGKRFGSTKRGKSHSLIVAFSCLAMLAGGCSKSEPEKSEKADKSEKAEKADNGAHRGERKRRSRRALSVRS